jgi:fluoride ion exporter CrcB/FEX
LKFSSKVIGLTFLGGLIGTALRFLVGTIPGSGFTSIWIVNLLGAIAIGVFLELTWFNSDERRAFFVTGLAGGFTTMSGVTMLLLYVPVAMLAQSILGIGFYLFTRFTIRKLRLNA